MIANVEATAAFLEEELKDFADVAVVGISGGVDSAVVASIAVAALGSENAYLVSMPYGETDEKTFSLRSAELADKLGAPHVVCHIGPATDAFLSTFDPAFEGVWGLKAELHELTTGNARARMRMMVLYAMAGELSYRFEEAKAQVGPQPFVPGQPVGKRVRVLGTGNASEDLIGYDTKGGDALADLFVIGELFKSEVYQLAKYYEVPESIIHAVPSAGLYEGQTDQAELGYSYEELEPGISALHRIVSRGVADEDLLPTLEEFLTVEPALASFVIERFRANAHKHRAPTVVKIRHTELVKDIWAL